MTVGNWCWGQTSLFSVFAILSFAQGTDTISCHLKAQFFWTPEALVCVLCRVATLSVLDASISEKVAGCHPGFIICHLTMSVTYVFLSRLTIAATGSIKLSLPSPLAHLPDPQHPCL